MAHSEALILAHADIKTYINTYMYSNTCPDINGLRLRPFILAHADNLKDGSSR